MLKQNTPAACRRTAYRGIESGLKVVVVYLEYFTTRVIRQRSIQVVYLLVDEHFLPHLKPRTRADLFRSRTDLLGNVRRTVDEPPECRFDKFLRRLFAKFGNCLFIDRVKEAAQ